MLKEFIRKRFHLGLDNEINFESTFYFKYLNLFKLELVDKRKFIDSKDFDEAYNEVKYVILSIKSDVINSVRDKFGIDFLENDPLKSKFNDDNFKRFESEIIIIILEKIRDVIFKGFKFKYGNSSGSDIHKLIIKNDWFSAQDELNYFNKNYKNMVGEDVLSNLKYLKLGCCRDFSFYYLAVFEMIGFSLDKASIALAPGHVFFRYVLFDGKHINWETVVENNNIVDDIEYIDSCSVKIDKKVLSDVVYLKNLNSLELEEVLYNNFSNDVLNHYSDFKLAYFYSKKSLNFSSSNPEFLFNNAIILIKFDGIKYFKEIYNLFLKALKLNSYNYDIHFNFARYLFNFLPSKPVLRKEIIFHLEEFLRLVQYLIPEHVESNSNLISQISEVKDVLVNLKQKNL
jgi:hypothetical protein